MRHFTKVLAAIAALGGTLAQAAITAEEAKQLGTTLTPIGAEMAGNKAGTIPPYTGGLTTPPPGFKPGDGIRPDPFANEKPRFSIDARNMAQYAGQLTEGAKALLQKYPTFRIDVYPTHRSVAFPKWVGENTAKVALRAKTANEGRSIEDAHAGFPFPIPKTGFEAMWNHLVRFKGRTLETRYRVLYVDTSGRAYLSSEGAGVQDYPYWDTDKASAESYFRTKVNYTGPARRAGEAVLAIDPLDIGSKGRRAWSYLPGQRRVRLAPDIAHDSPNPSTAGGTTSDDAYIFNGSMERYDFKLLGKKEMIVPYNAYGASYTAKQDELVKPNHLNPDLVRWELHRVWVVEANLRPGRRHIYSRRIFYLDEDAWYALASDEYDARGRLYRAGFAFMAPSYDIPAPFADLTVHYDFVTRQYAVTSFSNETGGMRVVKPVPEREWSADALAGAGVR